MALKLKKNRSENPPEACPLSECMGILGGVWTPNIIWYLRAGPRRFGELRIDVPKISAKVLTMRLRDLERKGVVTREVKPTSPPSVEYALTALGRELVPAIDAIVDVGHRLKQLQAKEEASHRPKRSPAAAVGGSLAKSEDARNGASARPITPPGKLT